MTKILYYFTSTFPAGFGEEWKLIELKALSKKFNIIYLVPFRIGGNNKKIHLPNNIKVKKPVLNKIVSLKNIYKIFLCRKVLFYFNEFFGQKVYRNKYNFIDWLTSSIYCELIRKNPLFNNLINNSEFGRDSILYFFWAKENAYIIPILPKNKFKKIIVRFHGNDLYAEREDNLGYVPYQKQILCNLTNAVFVSNNGMQYLSKKNQTLSFDKHILHLSSRSRGLSRVSSDNVLRIYSCGFFIKLKRYDLLAQALTFCKIPIIWSHIGDGAEYQKIIRIINQFPSNIKFKKIGVLPSEKVVLEYANHPVDLFINVSSSEGLPMGVVEAMSAGIPVIATDVGGTSEIVDTNVGYLIKSNISSQNLAKLIEKFYYLSKTKKEILRQNAKMVYNRVGDPKTNNYKLIKLLTDE